MSYESVTLNKTNRTGFLKPFLIYSLLFLIAAGAVYGYLFFYQNATLIRYTTGAKDMYAQRYMFLFEFKRFIGDLFTGGLNTWDWSLGLGADGYAFNASNLLNPFYYLMILVPAEYADMAISASTVICMYLIGVAYLLFARKIGHTQVQMVLGAVAYTFSPWMVCVSINQYSFLYGMILFPLVMLGIEKILRGESGVWFALIVGYTVLITFYFAYIIGIMSLLYFLVRYLTMDKAPRVKKAEMDVEGNAALKESEGEAPGVTPEPSNLSGKIYRAPFLPTLGRFIGFGLLGILISSAGLVLQVLKFGGATSATGKSIPMLFTIAQYLRMPFKLSSWTMIFENYSFIGVNPLCVAVVPVILWLILKRRSNAIMTLLLMICVFLPKASSVLNFFSYMSGRWMFALAFFFTLAAMECLDERYLRPLVMKIAVVVMLAAYFAYLYWEKSTLTELSGQVMLVNGALTLVFMVLVMLRFGMKEEMLGDGGQRILSGITAVVMLVGIAGAYGLMFGDRAEQHLKFGEAEKLLAESPQHIATSIKDTDFYRVDQEYGIQRLRTIQSRTNEAMYFGTRTNYVFSSSVDVDWLNYNKLLGNNMGYYKRTGPYSNDGRFGLDFLQGTRYFLGSEVNQSTQVGYDGSAYAAYGFETDQVIDGVELLKNKYDIGLGAVMEQTISESEWLKLSYPDREIAMLQAAVIPDDKIGDTEGSLIMSKGIKTNTKELKYKLKKDGNKLILTGSEKLPANHQLILSIRNLKRKGGHSFGVNVNNGIMEKNMVNSVDSEQGLADITDYTVNLGRDSKAADHIVITLKDKNAEDVVNSEGGESMSSDYTYDEIILYAVDCNDYAESASNLEKTRFQTTSMESSKITGTVNSEKGGMLYLSIPGVKGWTATVDGHPATIIRNTDVCFSGIALTPGEHKIELRYHTVGLIPGLALSGLGLLLLIICGIRGAIIRRRLRKNA